MKHQDKTKEQLMNELEGLRQRVAELEAADTERKRAEEALRESEAQLSAIFDNVPMIMILVDRERRVRRVNRATIEFTGRPAEEMIGLRGGEALRCLNSLDDPRGCGFGPFCETCPVRRVALDTFETRNSHHRVEAKLPFARGEKQEEMDLLVSTAPLSVSGSQMVLVCVEDITERKRAEEALRESEERYRHIFEQFPIGIGIASIDGKAVAANKAMQAITGYSVEELKKIDLADTYENIEDREALLEAISRYGGVVDFPVRLRRKDSTPYDALLSISRINLGGKDFFHTICQDITERKRAEEALRRRAEELDVLQATVLDITARHDLPTLLQTIVERAALLLNALGGGLYLCDPDQEETRCVVSYNTPRDYTGTVLKYGEGAAGIVAQTGEPLIIDDYHTWSRRAAAYEEEQPFTAVLSAPMIWQGQVTGVIHVLHNVETRRFTQADLELLTLFANHAAISVENARLHEETRQRALEQETLREAALALTTALDRNRVIERILAQLQQVVPYDSASVQLLRENQMEIVGGRGFPNLPDLLGTLFPVDGDNPNHEVVRTQAPFIVENAPAVYEGFRKGPHMQTVIRSWLGVPMLIGERLVGMIALDKREPGFYTQQHARLAEAFAAQGAIAIENARLFEQAQQEIVERKRAEETIRHLAYHDALTGLPNRILFNDRLTLALAHAQRDRQKLGVMLLDLDHFKDVNDTLGHGVGDQLLQVVGQRLTSLLRKGDTVARMGGDEFILLLPEIAGGEDVAEVAAKILEAIRRPFVLDGHEIHTTTSIGIALYPDDGEDVDTLVKNADIAMYRAKDRGRDNYQRYTPAMSVKALE